MKVKENITLELYFDLGKEFEQEDVEFSLNFTKSIYEINSNLGLCYYRNKMYK